ncbi:MAG: AP2 domain-containing protein, partial [Deltaproteobacteria bacterium]
VRIKVDNKLLSLGRYSNIDDAVSARKEAEVKYNFTQV